MSFRSKVTIWDYLVAGALALGAGYAATQCLGCDSGTRHPAEHTVLGFGVDVPHNSSQTDVAQLLETTAFNIKLTEQLLKGRPLPRGKVVWCRDATELSAHWTRIALMQPRQQYLSHAANLFWHKDENTIYVVPDPINLSNPQWFLGHGLMHLAIGDDAHANLAWRSWDQEYWLQNIVLGSTR